jgi:hypothetical protein
MSSIRTPTVLVDDPTCARATFGRAELAGARGRPFPRRRRACGERPTGRLRRRPGRRRGPLPRPSRRNDRWDWINLPPITWWRSWGLSKDLDVGLTKLAAALYDVDEEYLPALRQEERRRRKQVFLFIGAIATTVALVVAVLAGVAWWQWGLSHWAWRACICRARPAARSRPTLLMSRLKPDSSDSAACDAGPTIRPFRPARASFQRALCKPAHPLFLND